MAARSRRAADSGSGASVSQRTTTKCDARRRKGGHGVGRDPAGDVHRSGCARLGDVLGAGARPPRLGRRRGHGAGREVVDRLAEPASSSAGAWVESPTMASGPRMRRASAGGASSWPTWTPSAPASRARSGRSFKMNGTPKVGADLAGRGGPSQERPGVELLLPELDEVDAAADAGLDEGGEVGAVGGAEVEPTAGEAPGPRPGHGRDGWPGRSRRAGGLRPWRPPSSAACARRTSPALSASTMSATERKVPRLAEGAGGLPHPSGARRAACRAGRRRSWPSAPRNRAAPSGWPSARRPRGRRPDGGRRCRRTRRRRRGTKPGPAWPSSPGSGAVPGARRRRPPARRGPWRRSRRRRGRRPGGRSQLGRGREGPLEGDLLVEDHPDQQG